MTGLVPLKRVASLRPSSVDKKARDGEVPIRLCNYTDVYYRETIRSDMQFMPATATHAQLRDFTLRHGDVIVTKDSETADDVGIPAFVEHPPTDLVCGYHLTLIRPNQQRLDGRFLFWQMSATHVRQTWEATAAGVTRVGLRAETVANLPIRLPHLAEQRAIANYLDTETSRIDALIDKKRHKMDLLKDRLTASIRQAISEGLTASELRETEVAVVPRLPTHWELTRARFVCRVETGAGDTVQAMEDGEYPFFVRSDTVERSGTFLFDTEAVLTAGDGAGVAKVFHHYSGKFNAHQRVYVMHEFRRVLGRYYFYCLRILFPLVALDGSAKSTVDSVRRHMLTDMPVPLPPLEEQAQIVRALDREVARTDRMLVALEKQLELLKEHRQAFITAAVTGKLKVPGVAA